MIPIVLTSATATPDMAVWVWLLGDERAIPRNYYHVVLDDAALDWAQLGGYFGVPVNYEAVVSRAVRETVNHHAFVTELAQPTKLVKSAIFPPGQFGNLADLKLLTDAGDYLRYLKNNAFPFSALLVSILQKYIKQPPNLRPRNGFGPPPDAANYYYNFDFWKTTDPQAFMGFDLSFDAVALTNELDVKIVTPVRAAAALFDQHPYLTRLHTRIGPEDMNRDPVFSFNPFLPDVAPAHLARMQVGCDPVQPWMYDATLTTEEGFVVDYPGQSPPRYLDSLPGALRIEILREDGVPDVVVDNTTLIRETLGIPPAPMAGPPDMGAGAGAQDQGTSQSSGCSAAPGAAVAGGPLMVMFALVLFGLARRRRVSLMDSRK
jgi:MYXO-CTERM domain-containing protein